MKRGILFLLLCACTTCCVAAPADQNGGNVPPVTVAVEQSAPVIDAGPDAWKASVYGEDWQLESEKIGLLIPEFAADQAIAATNSDADYVAAMPDELPVMISLAIETYYLKLEKITQGYAGRKFIITAARSVEGYILLWLDEPDIRDGGRAIIYSRQQDKIVADFIDGGTRG